MDRPTREALKAQLHCVLLEHFESIERVVFAFSGHPADPVQLRECLVDDLETSIAHASTTASAYSPQEMMERFQIAREVVADICMRV
jgi:hypothetical protein